MSTLPAPRWRSALLLSAALLGCDPADPASSGETEHEAWSIAPEPELVIGSVEGDLPYLFAGIADAALLPDGRVVVADRGASAVRVYAADGTFEREIGRSGEGPGEFATVRSVDVLPPDSLLVYDSRLQRLTTVLADGTLVDTDAISAPDGWVEIFLGRFEGGDLGFAWIKQGARSADQVTADPMQLARFGPEGEFLTLLGVAEGMRRFGRGPTPFSPFLHAAVSSDRVYVTDGLAPEVTVMDREGAVVGKVATPPAGVEEAEAWASLASALEERGDPDLLERLETVPRTEPVPHIAEMILDDRGLLWTKAYDPRLDAQWLGGWAGARGGTWSVMDPEGAPVATLSMPEGFIPLDVRGDKVLGMTRDDLGVERIVLYRVRR